MSLIQFSKKPFTNLIKYSAPNNNVAVLSIFGYRNQSSKSSVEKVGDAAEKSPYAYSPFKVPFANNKAEWAVARVDDILNVVRKVSFNSTFFPSLFFKYYKNNNIRVHCGH